MELLHCMTIFLQQMMWAIDPQTEVCALIDVLNCFQWELYDCRPSGRATICQAGKLIWTLICTRFFKRFFSWGGVPFPVIPSLKKSNLTYEDI